jgi:hypothetical protein
LWPCDCSKRSSATFDNLMSKFPFWVWETKYIKHFALLQFFSVHMFVEISNDKYQLHY